VFPSSAVEGTSKDTALVQTASIGVDSIMVFVEGAASVVHLPEKIIEIMLRYLTSSSIS
jgi:hypothetical protein